MTADEQRSSARYFDIVEKPVFGVIARQSRGNLTDEITSSPLKGLPAVALLLVMTSLELFQRYYDTKYLFEKFAGMVKK